MNKEWSGKNKRMQALLKADTFSEGIRELMGEMLSWRSLPAEKFCAIPFLNADGYRSKTVAYSLWHIFRIENIVVNSLIRQTGEVLTAGGYAERIHAPSITTGNELRGLEIAEFSRKLDIDALYRYIEEVKRETDEWLCSLEYPSLKKRFVGSDAARLRALGVVSGDEEAAWLVDYWCGKDIKGLIKMPLSRHWIMHIEAALRILDRLEHGR